MKFGKRGRKWIFAGCLVVFVVAILISIYRASMEANSFEIFNGASRIQNLNWAIKNYGDISVVNIEGLLKTRKSLMLDIAKKDTSEFMANVLDENTVSRIPLQLRKNIEEQVTLSGKMEVIAKDDFEHHKSSTEYNLISQGKKYNLSGDSGLSQFIHNDLVSVRGLTLENRIIIPQGSDLTLAQRVSPTYKYKKVAIILGYLTGYKDKRASTTSVAKMMYTDKDSVRNFYWQNSNHKIYLRGYKKNNGSIHGWYKMPYKTSSQCMMGTWTDYLVKQAKKIGFSYKKYNNVIFVVAGGNCGVGGVGSVGNGNGEVITFSGNFGKSAVIHEMGHNWGLMHANSYGCADRTNFNVPISAWCSKQEYGDSYDTMGMGFGSFFNSIFRAHLGWMGGKNLKLATKSGTHYLTPIEKRAAETQLLMVRSNSQGRLGYPSYYYVEYRNGTGIDSKVGSSVTVREAGYYKQVSESYLVNPNPTNSDQSKSTYRDNRLFSNKPFYDASSNVAITFQGYSKGKAKINVKFGQQICEKKNPSISISKGSNYSQPLLKYPQGSILNYTLEVINNDSYFCPADKFSLALQLSPGWEGVVEPFEITMFPRVGYRAYFRAYAPSSLANGDYHGNASITRLSDKLSTKSGAFTASIDNTLTDTRSPSCGIIKLGDSWISRNSVFSIYASDDLSGVGYMRYSGNKTVWSPWEKFLSNRTLNFTNPNYGGNSNETNKTIYLQVKDGSGKTGSCESGNFYKYDASPPSGSLIINYNEKQAFSRNASINFNVTDKRSGLDSYRLSNDNVYWSPWIVFEKSFSWGSWEKYTYVNWKLSSSIGTKTVYGQVRDVAGNVSGIFKDTIIYDP